LSLSDPKIKSSRSNRSRIEYAEREELEDRPAGFLYPNFIEPQYVMDLEDLMDDTFLMVCVKDQKKVFIWKGHEFSEEEIVR
jgi:hypothetical protein